MVDLTRIEWLDADRIAEGIQRQGPQDFADLGNDVLVEMAIRIGASPGCVRTTLSVFENDDGLDAACIESGEIAAPWIPDPDLVGYQFKSGTNDKSAREVVEDDVLDKRGVMEVINNGGAFVYITAWDRANFENDIRARAGDLGLAGHEDQLHYISGDSLARQITRLPALIARLQAPNIGRLFTFQEWLDQPRLQNPFEADDAVETRVQDLERMLQNQRARLVVVGRPGDGKTRTVREAVDGSGLEQSTLYARNPDHLPDRFLQYLRSAEGVKCTLVVDEVDPRTMRELEDAMSVASSDEVRLMMVGLTKLRREGSAICEILEVEPLSRDLLEDIVRSSVSDLPPEVEGDIARICSGSPKLALLLAKEVDKKPELTTKQRLLADRDVQDAIDAALEIDFTEPRWRAVGAVALLDFVGWTGEDGGESEELFGAAGLDVGMCRAAVEEIDRDLGILPEARNVRYVSPEVLADHLAAKLIRTWTRDQLRDFLERVSDRVQDGFASRIRTLGDALGDNRTVVEDLVLGDEGPFQTLDDLERGRASRVVRQLAGPYRYATLRLLHRVIGQASKDELEAATRCRRDLVNSLEELLWYEDTFEPAALLLLRLAAAENESWGNNATGIWTESFQTVLGRTEAGANRRIKVVRQAAESEDPDERRLAARAVEAGLRYGRTSRMGMPPKDLDDAPDEAWSPDTWDEWSELVLGYLDVLEPLLDDDVDMVHQRAVEALAEGTRVAVSLPGIESRWGEMARSLTRAGFDARAQVIKQIHQEVRRGYRELDSAAEDLPEARVAEIEARLDWLQEVAEELEGDDFESRFRRALTIDFHEFEGGFQEARKRIREALQGLAGEVVEDPDLLGPQWSWLTEERPVHVGTWLHELGAKDCKRRLAERIREVALDKNETWSWLSIYDLGFIDGCVEDEDSFITQRVHDLRESGSPPDQVLDFVVRVGYSPERFELLSELFEAGELAGSSIARLKYSGWTSELSLEEVRQLLRITERDAESQTQLVTFLYGFLRENPDSAEELRDEVLTILPQSTSSEEKPTFDFEWAELAEMYLPGAATEVATAVTDRIAQHQVSYDDRLVELLHSAWDTDQKEEILPEAILPWIDSDSVEAWWVRKAISRFPLWEVDSEAICDWVGEAPDHRARALAEVVGEPSGDEPSALHGELLDRFGAYDVGNVFMAELRSGTWMGSMAKRTQRQIEEVSAWCDDDRPAVRDWAERSVERLEQILEQERERELEEDVRRGNRPPRPN